MKFKVLDHKDWVVVQVEDRVDAFNCDDLTARVSSLLKKGQNKIAFNLGKTQFLSLPSIKFMSSVASDVDGRGGDFALVAPSEKLKRQIDIFASLDSMKVYRSFDDWDEQA